MNVWLVYTVETQLFECSDNQNSDNWKTDNPVSKIYVLT